MHAFLPSSAGFPPALSAPMLKASGKEVQRRAAVLLLPGCNNWTNYLRFPWLASSAI
jgi:hypothetical protein